MGVTLACAVRDRPTMERENEDPTARHEDVQERAREQIGTPAAELRPDLATDPDEDRTRTSDRGDRHRASSDVTVADNAGQTPGAEQGSPDIGQEAGTVSEPG